AARGAALLGVVVGEHHDFLRHAVDVGCLVAHQTMRIGTDIGLADVVAPQNDDVRLLLLRLRNTSPSKDNSGGEQQRFLDVHGLTPSKENTFFQSDFMLMTIQFLAFASSQALSSFPTRDLRS